MREEIAILPIKLSSLVSSHLGDWSLKWASALPKMPKWLFQFFSHLKVASQWISKVTFFVCFSNVSHPSGYLLFSPSCPLWYIAETFSKALVIYLALFSLMGADVNYWQVLLKLLHAQGFRQSCMDGRAGSVFSSTGKPDSGIRNSSVHIWLPGRLWGGVSFFEEIRSFLSLWRKLSKSVVILSSHLKLMKFERKRRREVSYYSLRPPHLQNTHSESCSQAIPSRQHPPVRREGTEVWLLCTANCTGLT